MVNLKHKFAVKIVKKTLKNTEKFWWVEKRNKKVMFSSGNLNIRQPYNTAYQNYLEKL